MRFVRGRRNKRRVCGMMNISRSTVYYKRKARNIDPVEELVLEIFDAHNSNYGCPRIKVVLEEREIGISKRRIGKILKKNNRESKHGRRKLAKNIHTAVKDRYVAENLIRGYTAAGSNEVCQLDTTQFGSKEGKLYVCGIIDIYDRTVGVGYGLAENKTLISGTISERIKRGAPMVIHSDRGAANVSLKVKELLQKNDILQSMSAPHSPNENQYIETFWKTMKTEIGDTKHLTREQLIMVINYYIHYYNIERLHSSIGYTTPHKKFLSGLARRESNAA